VLCRPFARLTDVPFFPLPHISTGAPDGMFTAGEGSKFPWTILRHRMYVHDLPFDSRSHLGPIFESDFFNWEALICGPKDTPFVRVLFLFFLHSFVFVEITNLSTTPLSQEGGVFSAKLTFVRGAFRP